ncbi:MAG: ATP-binding protein [Oscillospiraceae bacterium]|jgi:DNA replication protein DnaC|nr:ATP-binding protein [Oscillospiraceae bacterium]
MHYSTQVRKEAREILQRRQSDATRACDARRAAALAKIPALADADRLIQSSAAAAIAALFNPGASTEDIVFARDTNLQAQAHEQALLRTGGFAEDAMLPHYSCPDCDDSGYLRHSNDGHNGQICACHRALLRDLEHARLARVFPLDQFTFSRFNLSFYPSNEQEFMRDVLDTCKKYAKTFSPKKGNLYFYGGAGLGKTHLSGAIINRVIERGFSVEYGSAPALLDALVKSRFDSRSDRSLEKALQTCDLLVLDDLGAEAANSATKEALYILVNARLLAHKPTIVSSNFTPQELAAQYDTRIASRLLYDHTTVIEFVGNDIRAQMNRRA